MVEKLKENFSIKSFRESSLLQKAQLIGIYFLGVGYFNYLLENFWLSSLVSSFTLFFWPVLHKRRLARKEKNFQWEFQDFIYLLTNHLQSGKSLDNSFLEAADDLENLYGMESILHPLIVTINCNYRRGIAYSESLTLLSKLFPLPWIQLFTEIIGVGYRKGGDLLNLIKNVSLMIGDGLNLEREIEVLLARQKMEVGFLKVIPFLLLVFLKNLYPEMIQMLVVSPMGWLICLFSVGLIGASIFYSERLLKGIVL